MIPVNIPNQAKNPSIWGLVLFFNFSISSLWEQWGNWKGLLWTDVGFASSHFWQKDRAVKLLGINNWEILSTSTALSNSPPHTAGLSQNLGARFWSLWCSWLITGFKDVFYLMSTGQSIPHFVRSSLIPRPFHCWSTRNCEAQNDVHDQKTRAFLLPGYYLCSDHRNLALAHQDEVPKVSLKSSIPAILKEVHPHVP